MSCQRPLKDREFATQFTVGMFWICNLSCQDFSLIFYPPKQIVSDFKCTRSPVPPVPLDSAGGGARNYQSEKQCSWKFQEFHSRMQDDSGRWIDFWNGTWELCMTRFLVSNSKNMNLWTLSLTTQYFRERANEIYNSIPGIFPHVSPTRFLRSNRRIIWLN